MCNHPEREAAMVITHRNDEGVPTVWCDPCLEPLIRALNDGGLPTAASCCGHGHRPGRVSLWDGRELFLLPDAESAGRMDLLWPIDINGDRMDVERRRDVAEADERRKQVRG